MNVRATPPVSADRLAETRKCIALAQLDGHDEAWKAYWWEQGHEPVRAVGEEEDVLSRLVRESETATEPTPEVDDEPESEAKEGPEPTAEPEPGPEAEPEVEPEVSEA